MTTCRATELSSMRPRTTSTKSGVRTSTSQREHGHAHNLTSSNVIIQVYQDGKVWYSVRLTLTLSCPMWLAKYPMDNQTCPLELQSYMLSTDEQLLYWVSDTPVRFENEVNLPQFKLEGLTTGSAVVTNSI
ncbi:PREDICTED: glycine receptor subunit alpha-2-like, partial [Priapulus caudatus]|uniref:Glycine receptor subunit alpha-2-like n=1 Tax=Priapulus caudatus TaxID=37621 RepID=A0ABM1EVI3_PRICU